MDTLLLEIGTEEIPAGYIEPALASMADKLGRSLKDKRIAFGKITTAGTPKRLTIEVSRIAAKQQSLVAEIVGPPESISFDKNGNPTVAAMKFAEKVGTAVGSLTVTKTPKGKYLSARITEKGAATKTVLRDILPNVILSCPFPKTMRWGYLEDSFARPIHSILALLGKNVITFTVGGIRSGRHTSGHRFMHSGKIKINTPAEYAGKLLQAHVIVDIQKRKKLVEKDVNKAAKSLGGKVLADSELLDIVTNLVEDSAAVGGRFDSKYLELPDEVLITAMREHQKYFAVVDSKNKLMPCFIAVNNTRARDLALVSTGHERVLRARLEDARFFYRADLKNTVDSWVEKLKGVLFQADLGSVHDKVMRVQKTVEFLCDCLNKNAAFRKNASRAAVISKADLVSRVVVEFPKLQGVMGRVYAAQAGECGDVAGAIEEHYRPTSSGGKLPETSIGAILGIADKLDSICGCFALGLKPTGASDPYALRRQGIGILQIMLDKKFFFPLSEAIQQSVGQFRDLVKGDTEEIVAEIYAFLCSRLANILAETGFSKDVIAAVLHIPGDNIPKIWARVDALQKLKSKPDFEPLAATFKRVVNLIKKSETAEHGEVDTALLENESETALFDQLKIVEENVGMHLSKDHFKKGLLQAASLRPFVDAFFDGVMVLTENKKLQANRLALLGRIASLFNQFADFSKLST